jgi:hypothetical protein
VDDLDPDAYVLPDTVVVDTPTVTRRRRERTRRFVKGPLPLGWILACSQADANGILLAAAILMRTGRSIVDGDHPEVIVGDAVGKDLGLSRYQRHRAIRGLLAAGLIEANFKANRAPRVRLKPWRTAAATQRYRHRRQLDGPIPKRSVVVLSRNSRWRIPPQCEP